MSDGRVRYRLASTEQDDVYSAKVIHYAYGVDAATGGVWIEFSCAEFDPVVWVELTLLEVDAA